LRSTRETELFKLTNGNIKVVCSWIGNSPEVAIQHYAQVTEADLKEAAMMSIIDDAEKRVQNPMQTTAEPSRTEPHESKHSNDVSFGCCKSNQCYAGVCETVQKHQKWAHLDSNQGPTDYESFLPEIGSFKFFNLNTL
jgi:hypothetical protein